MTRRSRRPPDLIDGRPGGKRQPRDATDSIAELNGPQPGRDRKVNVKLPRRRSPQGREAARSGRVHGSRGLGGPGRDAIWHIRDQLLFGSGPLRAGGHADEAICQSQIYIDERPSGNRAKDVAVGDIA